MYLKKFHNGVLLSRETSINLELGMVKLGKGKSNKLGLHPDEEEAYIILKGSAKLLLGKENIKVKSGSIIYVPAGVLHQFTALTDDFEYIYAATWPEELKKKRKTGK